MPTERKQITVKGVVWTIASSNERICTVSGRHFFALRCHSGNPWAVIEMDRDLLAGSAREIGYLPHRLMTQHLSLAVNDITAKGETLPTKPESTPLNKVTTPASTEYLKRIGVDLAMCPYCKGGTPRKRGLTICHHCYALFDGKDASA